MIWIILECLDILHLTVQISLSTTPMKKMKQIDKTTITKLGDNLWEHTWETHYQ